MNQLPPPVTIAPRILAAVVIPWLFALATLCLRFVSRHVVRTGYWWDDGASIVAWLFGTAIVGGAIALTHHGLGQHVIYVGADGAHLYLKMLFVSSFCYALAVGFSKLSILLFYWRIFNQASARMRISIIVLVIITVAWMVVTFIISCTSCRPISAYWNWGTGKCIGLKESYIGFAIPNILTDILIMLVPIPEVLKLQMPWAQKCGLIFTFALGGMTVIVSTVRAKQASALGSTVDVTWELAPLTICSGIEIALATATANLPSIGPLAKHLWRKTSFSRSYRQRIYDPYPTHPSSGPGRGTSGTASPRPYADPAAAKDFGALVASAPVCIPKSAKSWKLPGQKSPHVPWDERLPRSPQTPVSSGVKGKGVSPSTGDKSWRMKSLPPRPVSEGYSG